MSRYKHLRSLVIIKNVKLSTVIISFVFQDDRGGKPARKLARALPEPVDTPHTLVRARQIASKTLMAESRCDFWLQFT